MATNLNPGAILEYRQYSQFDEQIAVGITHWRVNALTGTITDQEVLEAHDDLVAPNLKNLLVNTAVYLGGVMQIIAPVKRIAVGYTSNGGAGVNISDPLPRQVSGIFTKLTGSVGRKYRGRYYTPFPPENGNDNGKGPTDTYWALILDFANLMTSADPIIGGSGSATIGPVIFHRADSSYTDVTGNLVRHKWATQRRRGIYGRPNEVPSELL